MCDHYYVFPFLPCKCRSCLVLASSCTHDKGMKEREASDKDPLKEDEQQEKKQETLIHSRLRSSSLVLVYEHEQVVVDQYRLLCN